MIFPDEVSYVRDELSEVIGKSDNVIIALKEGEKARTEVQKNKQEMVYKRDKIRNL